MIKKTLYFGNPMKLRLQLSQLYAEYPDKEQASKSIPVEDIGLIILDHSQISITHGLVNALIGNNAAVLWCDSHHLPNGLLLNLAVNDTFSEKLRTQLDASEPLKKQLWKQTIQCKISNQAAVLAKQGTPIENMNYWESCVGSGDPENHEGRAAAYYWKNLNLTPTAFQAETEPTNLAAEPEADYFRRHRFGEPPNNLLNYGYAVLRAITARSLVASGCLPALGIHHHNKYNAFCLADDIMEPYRPYVDQVVIKILNNKKLNFDGDLTPEVKRELLQIPVLDVYIDKQTSPLMIAMQRTTSSLMKCFEGEGRKILYPVLNSAI